MQKFKILWDNLPKSVRVFFYLALSTILAEVLIEFRGMEQTLLVRILAQLINMGIVLLEDTIPVVKAQFKK